MYLKALSIRPPLHPKFPYDFEQSTNCYSESETKPLPLMALIPSTEPVVEKAQQAPHYPWFLIGVTAFSSLQSTEAGSPTVESSLKFDLSAVLSSLLYPRSILYS